jgi:hypothetical protein
LLFSIKLILFNNLNFFKILKKFKLLNNINNLNFLSIINLQSNFIWKTKKFLNIFENRTLNINQTIKKIISNTKKTFLNKSNLFLKFLTHKKINFYYYLKAIILPVYEFNLLFSHINFNLKADDFLKINTFNKNLHFLYSIFHKKGNKNINPNIFSFIFLNNIFLKYKIFKHKTIYNKFPQLETYLLILPLYLNKYKLTTFFSTKIIKIKITLNLLWFYKKTILEYKLNDMIEILIISKLKFIQNFKNHNFTNLIFSNYNESNINYNYILNNNFKLNQINKK